MASVAKRPNGQWRARYRDEDGKEHSRHFPRKADAQRWLDEVSASVLTGQYVDPRAGKVTFKDYAEAWQRRQIHRPNTVAAVDSALRVHAIPKFGGRQMSSIKPGEVQAFVQELSLKVAPSTVRVTYQHLRAVFRAAADDRVIAQTPCRRITLPAIERRKVKPLETAVVLELAAAMPDCWRAMILLMAGTGLRPGEAAGLTVDRIDFLRRTLEVDRQLLLTWPPTFGPPKTAASHRTIPLPQTIVDTLAAHLAAYPAGDQGVVFSEPDGGPLYRDHVTRAFRSAVIATKGAAESTRAHDLRHYYASLLIRHGESVKVVQARLGHASASETLDTYSHLWPDSEDLTRLAIDDVLGAALADSSRTGEAL